MALPISEDAQIYAMAKEFADALYYKVHYADSIKIEHQRRIDIFTELYKSYIGPVVKMNNDLWDRIIKNRCNCCMDNCNNSIFDSQIKNTPMHYLCVKIDGEKMLQPTIVINNIHVEDPHEFDKAIAFLPLRERIQLKDQFIKAEREIENAPSIPANDTFLVGKVYELVLEAQ